MAEGAFFTGDARKAVKASVEKAESATSAEIVIALRKSSATYRDVDYLAGFVLAFVSLLVLLFHPEEMAIEGMPVQVALAFALGAFVTAALWPLKRLLVSAKRKAREVRAAARASFYDRGITRTTGRTGVLVYVSMFERAVEVVPDIGVDPKAIGAAWDAANASMRRAITNGADFSAFLRSVEELGASMNKQLPRADDDVNELPDEPVME